MKNWPKLLTALLVGLVILNLLRFVDQKKDFYVAHFDVQKHEEVWLHSQYNVPHNEFRGNMDDPELFSLAGFKYVTGGDPSAINFEQGPLAKYFFGLSIVLFGNAAVVQFTFGLLILIVTALLSRAVLKNHLLSLFPVFLVSIDPLFLEQLHRVYLDLFLTLNLLVFLYLFLKSLNRPGLRFLAMFWVGIVLLSKSALFAPAICLVVGSFLLLRNRLLIKSYLWNLPWAALSYVAGYVMFFVYHEPLEFLKLHINQFRLYKSYVPEYPKFEIWRIIFTGWWRKWFGDFGLMPVNTWTVLWPIGILGSLAVILKGRLNGAALLLILFVAIWLAMISLKLVFPRYLLPVIPMIYILLTYTLSNLVLKNK